MTLQKAREIWGCSQRVPNGRLRRFLDSQEGSMWKDRNQTERKAKTQDLSIPPFFFHYKSKTIARRLAPACLHTGIRNLHLQSSLLGCLDTVYVSESLQVLVQMQVPRPYTRLNKSKLLGVGFKNLHLHHIPQLVMMLYGYE